MIQMIPFYLFTGEDCAKVQNCEQKKTFNSSQSSVLMLHLFCKMVVNVRLETGSTYVPEMRRSFNDFFASLDFTSEQVGVLVQFKVSSVTIFSLIQHTIF